MNARKGLDEPGLEVLSPLDGVILVVDELPDMLNSITKNTPGEYEKFLHWFRKTREQSLNNKVRWLVGGSVNLIAALDRQGKVKLINDLKVEPLSPFTNDEVEEYVTEMFRNAVLLVLVHPFYRFLFYEDIEQGHIECRIHSKKLF